MEIISETNALSAFVKTLANVVFRKKRMRIVEVKGYGSENAYENQQQFFHIFQVKIQNLGHELEDVKLKIVFQEDDGFGRTSFELSRIKIGTNGFEQEAETKLGSMKYALFTLRSYRLFGRVDPDGNFSKKRLEKLKDPIKNKLRIELTSQEELVAVHRLYNSSDRVKDSWNRFAAAINWKFNRQVKRDNQIYLKQGKVLPLFRSNGWFELKCFVDGFIEECHKRRPTIGF